MSKSTINIKPGNIIKYKDQKMVVMEVKSRVYDIPANDGRISDKNIDMVYLHGYMTHKTVSKFQTWIIRRETVDNDIEVIA